MFNPFNDCSLILVTKTFLSLSLSVSVYYQSIIMIFSNNFVIIVSIKRLFITCLFLDLYHELSGFFDSIFIKKS